MKYDNKLHGLYEWLPRIVASIGILLTVLLNPIVGTSICAISLILILILNRKAKIEIIFISIVLITSILFLVFSYIPKKA